MVFSRTMKALLMRWLLTLEFTIMDSKYFKALIFSFVSGLLAMDS